MNRRGFLQRSFAGGVLAAAATAGLLKPVRVFAGARADAAFIAKDADSALKEIFGSAVDATESGDIVLDVPLQAANGAVVPVEVRTSLPNPESITILVKKNPTPLLTVLQTTPRTGSYYALRIKMAKTDKVVVYVKSGGKLYMASQQVSVTVGGCGG